MKRPLYLAVFAVLSLAATPATQPEIRHGEPMTGSPPERSRRYMERLVATAEPTGHADPARLAGYLGLLKRELVHDPRLVAFSPAAELKPDGSITLTGDAEYPELRATAEKFLGAVGFAHVTDAMRLVPVGTQPGAVVVASKTYLYDRPAAPRETLTQPLVGDVLFLLAREGDAYLCHSSDGYLGYVAAGDVRPVDADDLDEALNAPKATLLRNVRLDGFLLPTGARLPIASRTGSVVEVSLPQGGTARLDAAGCAVDTGAAEKVEKVIATAELLTGTPYVWGGRTSDGVDCSGLVGTAFQSQGIVLPRDADEQALCGTLVATRATRDALRRGDLLFFISGRGTIHHVAIYLGKDKFLEATSPGVKVSSFNPKDKEYAPKRDASFGFAKRVLQ